MLFFLNNEVYVKIKRPACHGRLSVFAKTKTSSSLICIHAVFGGAIRRRIISRTGPYITLSVYEISI